MAPQAKSTTLTSDNLRKYLFDGSANRLVRLLAIPVRPQHDPSPPVWSRSDRHTTQDVPINSPNAICKDGKGAKRSRDDEAHFDSSRCHKQIKIQCCDEKTTPRAAITIFSLPAELHRLIFSYIEDSKDILSLGVTHIYFFWPIAREHLEDDCMADYGLWTVTPVVCVPCYRGPVKFLPNDYPPGLFSAEDIEALCKNYIKVLPSVGWNKTGIAWPFMSSVVSFSINRCTRGLEPATEAVRHPIYSQLYSIGRVETYFPASQQWILRNLTTKQLVRSEAIALSPDYIHGPFIDVIGFGEVVMSRICWPSSSSVGMTDTSNFSTGVWAGHCFDITTLSRHEAETDAAEWNNVSEGIAKEVASIWEAEYGVDWRDIACKDWHGNHTPGSSVWA